MGLAAALAAGVVLSSNTPATAAETAEGRGADHAAAVSDPTTVTYAIEPDLVTGEPVDLELDSYLPVQPSGTALPAIIWIHGGGFRAGNRSSLESVATAYAASGYVTLSIDYRLDPESRCQDVQDGEFSDPGEEALQRARCETAIVTAQHDAQGAVRWLRANAAELGVDPDRIAVGGFSAGAVTAVNVGQRADDPGDSGEYDDVDSHVSAVLAASGCSYFPESIDSSDAPLSLLATGHDRAIPFECVVDTADRTEATGVTVQRIFYPDEQLHARNLYLAHQAEVDPRWLAFLGEHV